MENVLLVIMTSITAISTTVYAFISYKILKEDREKRRELFQPNLMVELKNDTDTNKGIIEIKNYGNDAAYDVELLTDPAVLNNPASIKIIAPEKTVPIKTIDIFTTDKDYTVSIYYRGRYNKEYTQLFQLRAE